MPVRTIDTQPRPRVEQRRDPSAQPSLVDQPFPRPEDERNGASDRRFDDWPFDFDVEPAGDQPARQRRYTGAVSGPSYVVPTASSTDIE